jgi:hypothetical protein
MFKVELSSAPNEMTIEETHIHISPWIAMEQSSESGRHALKEAGRVKSQCCK